ncbi:hypothetical protein NE865_10636 [Phthorimaea operculella]|nr:hypothetical protein NE865_10636 [Phthorimaea operculella]
MIIQRCPSEEVPPVKIDLIDCGVDHEESVIVGEVDIELYPWLGILYYNGIMIILDSGSCTEVLPVKIDCGVDHEESVIVGEVDIELYPWLGILYYNGNMILVNLQNFHCRLDLNQRPSPSVLATPLPTGNMIIQRCPSEDRLSNEDMNGVRAVTAVVLVHQNFVLANAHDIAEMPRDGFKKHARVLLGERWNRGPGRRVRTFVLHPEYGETYNTLALVYLRDGIHNGVIKPMCPPPDILRDPEFYVVRFQNDYDELQKEVIPMYYVPPRLCKDFYTASHLYAVKMRPPHVVCACSIPHENVCVWDGGSMLVARDVWGRWQLLGFGVRGPGCSAPSRYLDMASYYPWVHEALRRFQPITISKINNHKYVLRASGVTQSTTTDEGSYVLQRYGVCDESEKEQYSDDIEILDNNSIDGDHMYDVGVDQRLSFLGNEGSIFDISAYVMYADQCTFEINIWGQVKDMKLIDPLQWRWEEGSYYEDFSMSRVEYRGPTHMTSFGFEPLDQSMWLPVYDLYTTTEYDPFRTPAPWVRPPSMDGSDLVEGWTGLGPGQFPIPRYNPWHAHKSWKRWPTTTKKFIYVPGFLGP